MGNVAVNIRYILLYLLLMRSTIYKDLFHSGIGKEFKGVFYEWCVC
jgi:hypothetical protein